MIGSSQSLSVVSENNLLDEWLSDAAKRSRRQGRPLVTLSYAQSLDGCLTVRRGRPTALSGEETLRLTHRLRAAHQAILVGIGTVLADDPQLNVRLAAGASPRPVVLDAGLRTPLQSRLMQRSGNLPWIVTGRKVSAEQKDIFLQHGAKLIECSERDGYLDLACLLRGLLDLGVERLMVEGGAHVITSFLEQRLVDHVMITVSPVWLGGLAAIERMSSPERELPGIKIPVPALCDPLYEQREQDLIVWGRMGEKKV